MQNSEVDELSTPSSNNDDKTSLPSSKIQDDDISIPSIQEEIKDTHNGDCKISDRNNNNNDDDDTFDLRNDNENVMNDYDVVNDQFDNNDYQAQVQDDGDEDEDEGEDNDTGLLQAIDRDIPADDDDYLSLNDNILTLKSETQTSTKVYIYNIVIYGGIFAIRFGNYVDGFGFFFCASTQLFVGVVSDDLLVMHFLSDNFRKVNSISVAKYLSEKIAFPTHTIKMSIPEFKKFKESKVMKAHLMKILEDKQKPQLRQRQSLTYKNSAPVPTKELTAGTKRTYTKRDSSANRKTKVVKTVKSKTSAAPNFSRSTSKKFIDLTINKDSSSSLPYTPLGFTQGTARYSKIHHHSVSSPTVMNLSSYDWQVHQQHQRKTFNALDDIEAQIKLAEAKNKLSQVQNVGILKQLELEGELERMRKRKEADAKIHDQELQNRLSSLQRTANLEAIESKAQEQENLFIWTQNDLKMKHLKQREMDNNYAQAQLDSELRKYQTDHEHELRVIKHSNILSKAINAANNMKIENLMVSKTIKEDIQKQAELIKHLEGI